MIKFWWVLIYLMASVMPGAVMNLQRTTQVVRLLTVNGFSDHVCVAAGSLFRVGQIVNLTTSGGPSDAGLQIQDIRGVSGSSDIALYLIDPANGLPFNATGYLVAQAATVTAPIQTLWYGVGTDDDAPVDILTDAQMQDILLAILPGGATVASNVAVTNWPSSQPVSLLTTPLPADASTETTLALLTGKINSIDRDPVAADLGLVVRPVVPDTALTAFGEQLMAERTPVASITFNYPANPRITTTTTSSGGTVINSMSLAVLTTSSNPAGVAQIESVNTVRYQAGVGIEMSCAMLFAAGVASSIQEVGLCDNVDGFGFGYNGSVFGVFHRSAGVTTWIAQTVWSEDKFDGTGPSGTTLDPTKLNAYKVQLAWHGPIRFSVMDEGSGRWVVAHIVQWANQNVTPSCQNPTLPFHVRVENVGNSTALVCKVASAGLSIEGKYANGAAPCIGLLGSKGHTVTGITTEATIVSYKLKASNVWGGTNTSRVRVRIASMSGSSSSGVSTVRVLVNPTIANAPTYTDWDTNTSVVQIGLGATNQTITGGYEVWSHQIQTGTSVSNDLSSLNLILNPGDVVAIVASGASVNTYASLQWLETP